MTSEDDMKKVHWKIFLTPYLYHRLISYTISPFQSFVHKHFDSISKRSRNINQTLSSLIPDFLYNHFCDELSQNDCESNEYILNTDQDLSQDIHDISNSVHDCLTGHLVSGYFVNVIRSWRSVRCTKLLSKNLQKKNQ